MASHTSAQPSEADLSEKQEVEANVSRMTSSRGLEFDVDEEARLVRKIDWMILPITTLLYLLRYAPVFAMPLWCLADMYSHVQLSRPLKYWEC